MTVLSVNKEKNDKLPQHRHNETEKQCFIFIHQPKASGTTLNRILDREYPHHTIYSIDGTNPTESIKKFKSFREEDRRRFRLVRGHMFFGLHEYIPGSARYITFLRNPVERIVSLYYFIRQNPKHYFHRTLHDQNLYLKQFVEQISIPEIDNNQTRRFSGMVAPPGQCTYEMLEQAKENFQKHFLIVGLTERFNESLLLMKNLFGWKSINYIKQNSSQRPPTSEISPEILTKIKGLNRFDMELYAYAEALLDNQIKAKGESFQNELKLFNLLNEQYHLNAKQPDFNIKIVPDDLTLAREVEKHLKEVGRFGDLESITKYIHDKDTFQNSHKPEKTTLLDSKHDNKRFNLTTRSSCQNQKRLVDPSQDHLKVIHINASEGGGAGIAAYRLHKGLQKTGVDSTLFVINKTSDDPSVISIPSKYTGAKFWQQWNQELELYPQRPDGLELFSSPLADTLFKNIPAFNEADIINLHWISGVVNLRNLPTEFRGKNIVLTLHDMNAFTGGCHYAGKCNQYLTTCQKCPQLGSDKIDDLSFSNWKIKSNAYPVLKPNIVTPSAWLGKCASQSTLLSPFPVSVIPYGVPLDIFKPYSRTKTRKAFSIPDKASLILFGADYKTKRKGFYLLLDALQKYNNPHSDLTYLGIFGNVPTDSIPTGKFKFLNFGRINDAEELAKIYSMSDAFVIPALEDNLPSTVIESLACGTPVIGFNVGGIPDMIDHEKTGYLVDLKDTSGIIAGIDWALSSNRSDLSNECRKQAIKRYGTDIQANAYRTLYKKLLSHNPNRSGKTFHTTSGPHTDIADRNTGQIKKNTGLLNPIKEKPMLKDVLAGIICGVEHSGTTIALDIMKEHKTLGTQGECGFLLNDFPNQYLNSPKLYIEHFKRDYKVTDDELKWIINSKDFKTTYQRTLEAHFRVIGTSEDKQKNNIKIIDKTPAYIMHLPRILGMTGDIPIIVMVKDPRNLYYSYKRRDLSLDYVIKRFKKAYLQILPQAISMAGNRILVIQFEDLVRYPQKTLSKMLSHFNLDNDPVYTSDYLTKAIKTDAIYSWQKNVTPEEVRLLRQHIPKDFFVMDHHIISTGETTDKQNITSVNKTQDRHTKKPEAGMFQRIAFAVNLFPPPDSSWESRQKSCIDSINKVRSMGLKPINICFDNEKIMAQGWDTVPCLSRSANNILNVPGKRKPFVNDLFNSIAKYALQNSIEWFAYTNNDIIITNKLIMEVNKLINSGYDTIAVSRNEVNGFDKKGRPLLGHLEFRGFDIFFCRTSWWQENSNRFQPYILGERAWDDAYVSIMISHSKCKILYTHGLCLHLTHPLHSIKSAYADWNMKLYRGPDKDYANKIQAFINHIEQTDLGNMDDAELELILNKYFGPKAQLKYVNICIVTYNRLEFTKQAIEEVINKTGFPYVLTVVDNKSTDGTIEYLKDLKNKSIIKNLILLNKNVGIAKASNLAWNQEPEASYYLKLDNDIVIQKFKWLNKMVATAEASPQIGAVAYNFEPYSYPLTSINKIPLRIKDKGNLGGACILIPKRTEKILGVWCEDYGLYSEEDADYGARIRIAGLINAYMPNENIGLHLPAGKAAKINACTFDAHDGQEELLDAQYRNFKDNCRKKALNSGLFSNNITAYKTGRKGLYVKSNFAEQTKFDHIDKGNPPSSNTSLNNSLQINSSINASVHNSIPVVSFNLNGEIPSSQYIRQVAPLKMLERKGAVQLIDGNNLLTSKNNKIYFDNTKLPENSIFYLQRNFIPYEFLLDNQYSVIYDIDDNLLDIPPEHPNFKTYTPLSFLLKKRLSDFSAVMTTTPKLQELLQTYNKNVLVTPNLIPFIPQIDKNISTDKIKILISGTQSHLEDIQFLIPAIKYLAQKYGNKIEFILWGYCPEELKTYSNITYINTFTKNYSDYLNKLYSINADIGLIPLTSNIFNSFKSDIKWKEYGLCRMAILASDTLPYKTIIHGTDGFLLKNNAEIWQRHIEKLIHDFTLRNNLGDKAYKRISTDYLLEPNISLWEDILINVGVPKPHAVSSSPLTQTKHENLVSIIIPVHNHADLTRQCLKALVDNTEYPNYEVIIVDNGSTDTTDDLLQTLSGDIKIIRNQQNLGFSKANNQGAQIADGTYLVFLNNDTIPKEGWLTQLVSFIEQRKDAGVVGCKLLYSDTTIQHCGVSMRHDNKFFRHHYKYLDQDHVLVNQAKEVDAVTAACIITPRAVFIQAGMFDEEYLNGAEDIDYCTAVKKLGNKVYYNPKAVLYHLESQTPRVTPKDPENFSRYVSKWGTTELKNEIQVYAENGFWAQNKDNVFQPKNSPIIETLYSQLKSGKNKSDLIAVKRFSTIINRIYPVKQWQMKNNCSTDKPDINVSQPHVPKILFVCHDFPPYRYAGAQLYAEKLARAINNQKLAHVDIFHPVFRENYNDLYSIQKNQFNGLTTFELRKEVSQEPEKVFNEKVAKTFDLFLKQNHYDCIHFHGLGQLSLAPVFVAHERNIKTVMTLHDYWLLCDRWHMIRMDQSICSGPEDIDKCSKCYIEDNDLSKLSESKSLVPQYKTVRKEHMLEAFNRIDKIYSPSRYLKNIFNRYGYGNIDVNPLGFEYTTSPSAKRRPAETLVFGYTGQIIKRKNVNCIIEAFKLIPDMHISLQIWGKIDRNDPYGSSIIALSKDDPRIKLYGEYNPAQLQSIYSGIDIALIPSLMENYPLVVQEAFLHKTPVIASTAGGIPETVSQNKNGILVTPGSITAFKDAMEKIIRDPGLTTEFKLNIPKIKHISEDAHFYSDRYGTFTGKTEKFSINQPTVKNEQTSKHTVQFYVYKNVHWPMFESLYHYLKDRDEVKEVIICLPDLPKLIGFENYDFVEQLFSLDATFTTNPRSKRVDVTFIADTIAGKVEGCGKIINVGHGTISKGYYFTDSYWTERENWVDLLCIPGQYALEQFKGILNTKVQATGMPKLDNVFSGKYNRENLCSQLNLDPQRKIILYAPTFNSDLSSVYQFEQRFAELLKPNRYILVKLHASTLGKVVIKYQQLAEQFDNLIFIKDLNIAPYIGGADILISDVSSVFLEFMALDKSVILYNNPDQHKYHGYNPKDIEYKWRDLGTQVNNFDELKYKLDHIIQQGDNKSAIRQKYAHSLFADMSGNATANVWNKTMEILCEKKETLRVPTLSVVLVTSQNSLFALRAAVYDLQFNSIMPIELVLVIRGLDTEIDSFINDLRKANHFKDIVRINLDETASMDEAYRAGIQELTGDIVITMQDNVVLHSHFDYIVHKIFQADQNLTALTGISNLPLTGINFQQYTDKDPSTAPDKLSYDFINQYQADPVREITLSSLPPLTAFKKEAFSEYSFNSMFHHIKLHPSLFYMVIPPDDMEAIRGFWKNKEVMPITQRIEFSKNVLKNYMAPDIAEQLITDQLTMGTPKQHLLGMVLKSIQTRFYDTAYKKKLINIFSDFPELVTKFSKEIAIIERLIKEVSLEKEVSTLRPQTSSLSQKRVLFYFFKNVHLPILIPIYKTLKQNYPEIQIAFGYMKYAPQIRAGFMNDELNVLESFGEEIYDAPQDFHPDLCFIADSVYPWVEGCGKIVHVGHGVLSKGQYYTNTETARREEQADLVCVPGTYHEQIMKQIISIPVAATGMAKLDAVFDKSVNRQTVLKQFGLPAGYRYILYAPTFNDELSAIPFVMDRVNEVIPDENTAMIIKLHGSAKQEYKTMYKNLVQKDKRVIFADEHDITPFLALCDLMISDVSSAMMEFAALDKPVVLFNNPGWESYQNYNPADIEFKWRDIGIQVTNLEEMKEAVKQSLSKPDEFSEKREFYTDQLFVNKYDGKAADRIITSALELLSDTVNIKGAA